MSVDQKNFRNTQLLLIGLHKAIEKVAEYYTKLNGTATTSRKSQLLNLYARMLVKYPKTIHFTGIRRLNV